MLEYDSPNPVTVIHGHKEYLCYRAVATVSKRCNKFDRNQSLFNFILVVLMCLYLV